jgi:hypothetical protein
LPICAFYVFALASGELRVRQDPFGVGVELGQKVPFPPGLRLGEKQIFRRGQTRLYQQVTQRVSEVAGDLAVVLVSAVAPSAANAIAGSAAVGSRAVSSGVGSPPARTRSMDPGPHAYARSTAAMVVAL